MTRIYIHYTNLHRGPGKVANNLIEGLKQLDEVEVVDKPNEAELIGCLQDPGPNLLQSFPEQTLMGPNLFVLPHENPTLCNKFENFVVPSDWVKSIYESFEIMKEKSISTWPVGIDTEEWDPEKLESNDEELDCFVYFKGRSSGDLNLIHKMCKYFKLNFVTIQYGNYQEHQLKKLCARSKFAILLTGTESQGVAYMNILNSNTPCYVFNKSVWSYNNELRHSYPAASTPYFNEQCGVISNDINLKDFESFIKNVNENKFSPREYILQNHTLKVGAQKYLDLLKKAYKA